MTIAQRRPARQAKTQARTTSVRFTLRSAYPVYEGTAPKTAGAHSRAVGERPQSCPAAAFIGPSLPGEELTTAEKGILSHADR